VEAWRENFKYTKKTAEMIKNPKDCQYVSRTIDLINRKYH